MNRKADKVSRLLEEIPGNELMEEILEAVRERRYDQKESYLLSWLSAPPVKMRSTLSPELDIDKRLDTVLSALHKERDRKILPFKKPRKK